MAAVSRSLVALATTLAALALPTIAHAEVVRGPEPVGDQIAWQADPDDPLCGVPTAVDSPEGSGAYDLTGISVRHKPYHVAVTARFAEPRARRFVELHLQAPRGRWMLMYFRSGRDSFVDLMPEPTWKLEYVDSDDDGTADCRMWMASVGGTPCDRLDASLSTERDALHVVIPRRCLGDPRWVQAGGYSEGWVRNTTVVDFWDPSGPDTADDVLAYDPNEHVYGPRVLAGPQADVDDDPIERGRVVQHAETHTETRSAYGLVVR